MKIRILGAGWYGCHIGHALIEAGHDVEIHEIRDRIFAGASGSIPARLHLGFHYPRSRMTRAACQEHQAAFMARYEFLTQGVPINLYAIAARDSLVDFAQYQDTLRPEVPFVPVRAEEYGLQGCEGAILTGERHIVSDRARNHFEASLGEFVRYGIAPGVHDSPEWDWTIDCTFGSQSAAGVDRYEPCLVLLMHGPVDRAITIMDGPFGSLYPWNEERGLCSLSSARWTPFSKSIRTYADAQKVIDRLDDRDVMLQAHAMIDDFARFYPAIAEFEIYRPMLSIRAMPRSGADTRLVDVARDGDRLIRVRAGKIDAIIHAEKAVRELMGI